MEVIEGQKHERRREEQEEGRGEATDRKPKPIRSVRADASERTWTKKKEVGGATRYEAEEGRPSNVAARRCTRRAHDEMSIRPVGAIGSGDDRLDPSSMTVCDTQPDGALLPGSTARSPGRPC